MKKIILFGATGNVGSYVLKFMHEYFNKDDYKNKILEFVTKREKNEEDNKKNEKSTPKKHWEEGFDSLKKLLDDEKTDIEFIKLLSMMMPKVKIEDEKNDK